MPQGRAHPVSGWPARSRRRAVCGLALVAVLVTGCAPGVLGIPRDPDGTAERVARTGVLRAGAAPRPGWVGAPVERGAPPTGREPELVDRFARSLGARVEWTVAGEEELFDQLSHAQLDLVVGGLTDKNPWVSEIGLTRPYTEVLNDRGETEKHVMAVPMGENAWQSQLEAWLDENGPPQ